MRLDFSSPDGGIGKDVIIFGIEMSSSVHIDDKKRDILILGIGSTQGLHDTNLIAEARYSIDFQDQINNFV